MLGSDISGVATVGENGLLKSFRFLQETEPTAAEVYEGFGGLHSSSPIGQALGELVRAEAQELSTKSVLEALGGSLAINPMASAMRALRMEERWPSMEPPVQALGEVYEALGGALAVNPIAMAFTPMLSPSRVQMNETAKWLAANYSRVRGELESHLASKLRTSRTIGVVEDHVSTFLERLIRKDYLAPYIQGGKKIQDCVLKVWAYQAACTEFRGWGTDASLRKTRGALTARERSGVTTARQHESPSVEYFHGGKEGGDLFDSTSDIYQPSDRAPNDSMEYREAVQECRRLVASKVPTASADKYLAVFDAMLAEDSRQDIISSGVVPEHRVTAMFAKVRQIVRESGLLNH